MTEYTRRELKRVTEQALRQLADDRRQGPENRAMALAARAQLRAEDRPKPDLREPYVCRFHVQPGLWLTVDASHNILLEVHTADEAELLAAYALSSAVDMADKLGLCRTARDAAEYDGEQERLREQAQRQAAIRWSEPRDGEDAASRACAATELYAAGLNVHAAQLVLKRAYYHLSGSFSVSGTDSLGTCSYDREAGTYSVRLPETERAAELLASLTGQDETRWEDPRDTRDGQTSVPE